MTRYEQAVFWVMAALCFLAFSPLDQPGGKIVAGLGAMICSSVAIVLLLRSAR